MQRTIISTISKISKKRNIEYRFIDSNECFGIFSGFNDEFAEFLDIKIIINESEVKIELSPQITFNHLEEIESLEKVNFKKINDNRIIIFSKIEYSLLDLEEKVDELYDLLFSNDVKNHYLHLLMKDWKNKHKK